MAVACVTKWLSIIALVKDSSTKSYNQIHENEMKQQKIKNKIIVNKNAFIFTFIIKSRLHFLKKGN